MKTLLGSSLLSFGLVAALFAADAKKLVVHEWGTFTSLQDENGDPIAGVNTDDEPVPKFVRRLSSYFFLSRTEAPPVFFQGTPKCHPDVTMRLETPVLYFYPPEGWKGAPFDVHVGFNGGWLTEYYPTADATAPGFDATDPNLPFSALGMKRQYRPIDAPPAQILTVTPAPRYVSSFGNLKADAQGELEWKGVKLGVDGEGPETTDKVWLAPRNVKAAMLETALGEKEKFLFYRGVGNNRAALRVVRKPANGNMLEIRDDPTVLKATPAVAERISAAWLLDVRGPDLYAFRSLGPLTSKDGLRATTSATFSPKDFAQLSGTMDKLQAEMRAALIEAGLFADEADALLRTWEVSYFKSPGLRLFYICTPAEVEGLLPLKISTPSETTRVMLGRIEIVTPEQRALLAKIAAGPALELWKMRGVTGDSQSDFFKNPENTRRWNAVMEGDLPYKDLGLPIPPLYADYLNLGRFRNALLLDEEKRRPTEALKEYIQKNNFSAYQIREKPEKP